MWIKDQYGDWVCADKICSLSVCEYMTDSDKICDNSELNVQLMNGEDSRLLSGSAAEAAYVKGKLMEALIENDRKVFDIPRELGIFRRKKEGRYIRV